MSSAALSSSLISQAQSNYEATREQKLLQQLKPGEVSNQNAKIEKSAKEFESMLLSNWLQQAEESMATVPGAEDDEADVAGREQMMGLGVQSLSSAMVASGGIGIASMIAKALHGAAAEAVSGEQTKAISGQNGKNNGHD